MYLSSIYVDTSCFLEGLGHWKRTLTLLIRFLVQKDLFPGFDAVLARGAGGTFARRSPLNLSLADILVISIRATSTASILSSWSVSDLEKCEKRSNTPKTSSEGASPYRPIVSFKSQQ